MRGDAEHAEARRRELVADHGVDLSFLYASGVTVEELLGRWVRAMHGWKPSTLIGYESTVRFLRADSIGSVRLCSLRTSVLYRSIARWQSAGATVSVVSGRSKVLCSALTWAIEQGILRSHPLAGMRRPPQPLPRLPVALDDVDLLLSTAAKLVATPPRTLMACGGSSGSSRPSRQSCWYAWPRTPGRAGVSWPR